MLAPDQWGESSGLDNIKATGGTTRAEHVVEAHGPGDATQRLCSQVLAGKIALDQAIGRTTDHQRIGRSQSCNARSNVGHFSQGQLFLASCSAHFTDNHQSSMDAHMNGELDTFILLQTGIEVSHGIEDTQARSYCSLGIIFVCHWIAKVHQKSIPEQLGNIPVIALDYCGTRLLIRTDDVSIHFGVESA